MHRHHYNYGKFIGELKSTLIFSAYTENDAAWDSLTYEEKNRLLYERQKHMLDEFLEHGAISQEQHDKSLHDLIEKMGMKAEVD